MTEPSPPTPSLPAPELLAPALPISDLPATDRAAPRPSVAPTTSGSAIGAFLLALASWVVIPVIPAIVALVIAPQADRDVAQGRGGAGLTTAARVISWVNIGVWAAVGLVVVGVIVLTLLIGAGG